MYGLCGMWLLIWLVDLNNIEFDFIPTCIIVIDRTFIGSCWKLNARGW